MSKRVGTLKEYFECLQTKVITTQHVLRQNHKNQEIYSLQAFTKNCFVSSCIAHEHNMKYQIFTLATFLNERVKLHVDTADNSKTLRDITKKFPLN
jgi:hypothetical protein